MAWFSQPHDETAPTDEQAVARYRYMLRTAPPEAIEEAHEEAFRQLTPEQRQIALQQLAEATPVEERRSADGDPKSLARLATRAEIRQPGILERLFGRVSSAVPGGGAGFGGVLAGSILASLAGTVIGSAVAHTFFDSHPFAGGGGDRDDLMPYEEPGSTFEDTSVDDDLDTGFDDLV